MTQKNPISVTRLAGLVLAAGLFYSCASSKIGLDTYLANKDYAGALTEIEKELNKQPQRPDLYYQIADINGLLAEEADVTERSTFYTAMMTAIDSVKALAGEDSGLTNQADSLATYYRSKEYDAGLETYEVETGTEYIKTISSANNAIILDRYNEKAYRLLSVAQYNAGNPEAAINTLNNAIMVLDDSSSLFEDLGFLYLEVGNAEQSAYYYNLANTDISKNKNIAFGLVNAYIAAGNNDNALDLLNQLATRYPKDADIHNVYGTQLYEKTNSLFEELKTAYVFDDTVTVESLKTDIIIDSEFAEEELIKAYNLQPDNVGFIESLAVFYNNMAGNYFSLEKIIFEEDAAITQKTAMNLVDFAIDYYSKLAGMNVHSELYSTKLNNLKNLKETRLTN